MQEAPPLDSQMPLVTIVTPTLNQGSFIGSAIRAVAAQSYAHIEHVVIDGGSTDGTLETLKGKADRLRWVSEPDRGMYDAINKGVAVGSGEILGYLNSDDVYLPWAVETIVAAFQARPDIDVLFGDGIRIDERTGRQELRLFPAFDSRLVAHHGSVMQPAVFWRRRLLDRIGAFDDRLRYVADLDYWLRAAAAGPILHVDEVLAVDRIHPGALSVRRRDEMETEELAMRKRHGADLTTGAGRALRDNAVRRDKLAARRLWLRFVRASLAGGPNRPWSRFLSNGETQVSASRILLGQLPRIGYPMLQRAVSSGLAAQMLTLTR